MKGEVLDLTGAAITDTSDDWYNHQDLLPVVPEPAVRDGVDGGAKFLGWTTKKNTKVAGGGWPDITTSELNEIKANGLFFEGGESIERPMDLYPVYASLGMNVNVIVEGHELIAGGDANIRENVAMGKVVSENGQYKLTLRLQPRRQPDARGRAARRLPLPVVVRGRAGRRRQPRGRLDHG
ncbi:MAG: hypothetical protein ACLTKG_02460 [Collinsella intestinalis]